jgi:hypothetical protein
MQFEYFCLKDSIERLVSEKLLSPVKCVDLTLPTLLRVTAADPEGFIGHMYERTTVVMKIIKKLEPAQSQWITVGDNSSHSDKIEMPVIQARLFFEGMT